MDRIIAFDICSLLIISVLYISFHIHKMSKGQANINFKMMVIYVLFSIVTDIFRICISRYFPHNEFSRVLFTVVNCLYLLSRNLTSPVFILFIYALAGKWHYLRKSKFENILWHVDFAVICIDIFVGMITGKLFTISEELEYHGGICLKFLYIISILNLIYIFVVLFVNRRTLNRGKFLLILHVILITIVGVTVEYFNHYYNIELLCTAFPMFFIFLLGQKPEESIDYTAECMNYYAFINDLKQYDLINCRYSVLLIKIIDENELEQRFSDLEIKKLLVYISKSLLNFKLNKDTSVYYLNYYLYAVTVPDSDENFKDFYSKKCVEFFNGTHKLGNSEVYLRTKLCELTVPSDMKNSSEIISFCGNISDCIAKNNQLCVFSEEAKDKAFKIKLNINDIINRAIEKENFRMYYQPIYNVHTGKFESAEALIRLIDDEYGFISPGLFIPAAEASGAIHQVGDFVIKDVFRFISSCNFEELGLKYIELNLSVAQCIEVNLIPKINAFLQDSGIEHSQVNLEITESVENLGSDLFEKNIFKLSEQGYDFSLDDFGTGYSNVERIIKLPVSIIKLDKSFADEYLNDDMKIIIKDTISMIHQIGRHALIEGIEDEVCLEQFKEWGIDYVQGYIFSKPLPEKDYLDFLKTHNLEKRDGNAGGGNQ